MLRFLARFLAVVFAALFVVAAVVAVFVRPIGTQMLDPQTYKRVLVEKQVAERLPELAAETIAKAAASARKAGGPEATQATEDFGGLMANLSQADLQTLVAAALPADYVRGQCDGAIDQVFAYLNSDAERPVVKLSLVDLKRRLAGGVLEDAYVAVLQTKPPCGSDTRSLPVGCCPPPERLPEVRAKFQEMISPAVREMPDSVDLFAERGTANADAVYAMMAQLRGRLHFFAVAASWVWVLPVLLLLAVAVFGVRSFRGLLLWWGISCLLAGGFAMICALPSAAMGDWVFALMIKPALPADVPVLAVETVLGVITAIAQVVLGAALKAALWLTLGGLAAIVLSFFFRKRATPAVPSVPPAAPKV